MYKRTVASILTAFMLIVSVAGCGSSGQTQSPNDSMATVSQNSSNANAEVPKKLSILYMKHWVPEADAVVETRAKEWGKQNNVEVTFSSIAEADFLTKVASCVDSKSGPDISLFRIAMPIVYKDALLDVSDIAQKIIDERGEFFDGNKAESFADGKWITIPFYTIMSAWMVRTDILQEKNVPVPKTYDELYDACAKLNDPKGGVYALGEAFSHTRDGNTFVQNVLWSYGSQLAGTDGKTVTFNSPETLAGLKYIVSLYDAGFIPPGATGWDDSSNNKAWQAGQLAMTSNAPSVFYNLQKDNDPLAKVTSHAVWPEGPKGRSAELDSYSLGIMKYTPNPDEARALLTYLTSEDVMREFYEAGGGFQFPVQQKFMDMDVYQNPVLKEPVSMLYDSHSPGWPGPMTPAAAEVENQSIMVDMVARVLVDKITPEAALDEATQRIQEIYDKYK
jgi:multiple sugar transport system substrate-binding protein